MDRSTRFRTLLARHLLQAMGIAALAPLVQAGCSDDDDDGTTTQSSPSSSSSAGSGGSGAAGAAGGEGGSDGGSGGVAGEGGAGGAGGLAQGGAGGTGGTGGGAGGEGVGGGQVVGCGMQTACFVWDQGTPCPVQAAALDYFLDDCSDGCYPGEVLGPPTASAGMCCYPTLQADCGIIGRPFLVAGRAVCAASRPGVGGGWRDSVVRTAVPTLQPALRAVLADEWARDALLEHASVAAFSRFSLELLAVGAPSELVTLAHQAALDEVRHARACFAIASSYLGAPIEPAAFPFGGSVEVSADLADVAARAVHEGCVGETVAAALAAEQAERASDAAVRQVLAGIAADESRHAELAWRTVAWAIRSGGDRVRIAVRDAFAAAMGELALGDLAERGCPDLEPHGRLSASSAAAVRRRALREVVGPCAAALLADAGHDRPRATAA